MKQSSPNVNAVIYIRVSTEKQADPEKSSPQAQEKDSRELAESMGLNVVRIYRDTEKYRSGNRMVEPSGTRSDRPALLQMIADAKAGLFDTIIAWREDRLYRGVTKALLDVSELVSNHNISIFLVKEKYDPQFAVIKAWMAGQELLAKSDRTTMGIKGRLAQGKIWKLPQTPYGYFLPKDSNQVEENKEESIWVREIFKWFASGVSTNEIRQRLLANNATQGKGTDKRKYDWANRRILKLLDYEPYYTGIMKIEWDDISYQFPVPVLVDQKTAQGVIERKAGYQSYKSGATKYPTLTQGLVYCHADGNRLLMSGARGGYSRKDGSKVRYAYYRCENNKNRYQAEGCCKNISSANLDKQVWNRLWEVVSTDNRLSEAITKRIGELREQRVSASENIEGIEKQLGELLQERQKVINWAKKKIITEEDLELQLVAITAQENALRNQLNETKLAFNNKLDDLIELSHLFTKQVALGFANINKSPRNAEEAQLQFTIKQRIVKAFVKRIEVFENHSFSIALEINLSTGNFIDQDAMIHQCAAPA